MYKCKYCRNKDIRGIRYLKACDLFPPTEKEGEIIQELGKNSNTVQDSWHCWNCNALEDDFDDLAEWSVE